MFGINVGILKTNGGRKKKKETVPRSHVSGRAGIGTWVYKAHALNKSILVVLFYFIFFNAYVLPI